METQSTEQGRELIACIGFPPDAYSTASGIDATSSRKHGRTNRGVRRSAIFHSHRIPSYGLRR